MSATRPTVHVVDDDSAARHAMQSLLNSVALPSRGFGCAEEFLAQVTKETLGCVLLDLRMPGTSGLQLQAKLRSLGCHLPVIFITGHGTISTAVRAIRAGAFDFLTKPVDDDSLVGTIHAALKHHEKQRQSQRLRQQANNDLESLTPREAQVLEAVSRGLTNKQIARELTISPKTVELHRAHMMEKMQADSIAGVVQRYMEADGSRPAV